MHDPKWAAHRRWEGRFQHTAPASCYAFVLASTQDAMHVVIRRRRGRVLCRWLLCGIVRHNATYRSGTAGVFQRTAERRRRASLQGESGAGRGGGQGPSCGQPCTDRRLRRRRPYDAWSTTYTCRGRHGRTVQNGATGHQSAEPACRSWWHAGDGLSSARGPRRLVPAQGQQEKERQGYHPLPCVAVSAGPPGVLAALLF